MDADVYIYTGNHNSIFGIEDYVTIFTYIFENRNIKITLSDTLKADAINIVIDEFTDSGQNNLLKNIKQSHPNTKLVFVLTEFIENRYGITSFNHFGGVKQSFMIALANYYLRLSDEKLRNIKPEPSSGYNLLSIPVMALLTARELVRRDKFVCKNTFHIYKYLCKLFIKANAACVSRASHDLYYFQKRFLGLLGNIQYADAIISSHNSIFQGLVNNTEIDDLTKKKFIGVFRPEMDPYKTILSLKNDKKNHIEVTGSITPYRKKWIKRINKRIHSLQLTLGSCQFLSFEQAKHSSPSKRAAYSIHPPQTETWPYSSPTRIFRALACDHSIPILTNYFGQDPIEDVCLRIEDEHDIDIILKKLEDKDSVVNYIAKNIQIYNDIARSHNDIIVASILKLRSAHI